MEEFEEGKQYSIEWNDGERISKVTFQKRDRGFLVFVDKYNNKVVCRPDSVRITKESKR